MVTHVVEAGQREWMTLSESVFFLSRRQQIIPHIIPDIEDFYLPYVHQIFNIDAIGGHKTVQRPLSFLEC